jgi:uncharacterized repeat protein (TIGR01451 family)
MKAKILSFLILCSTFISAQIVNIPDANFKAKLLQASPTNKIAKDLTGNYFKIDANGNGEIEVSEAEKVTYLDVNSSFISTLAGILNFKKLQNLSCAGNQLTSLDISKNTALTSLYCAFNKLTSLDVSKNTALTSLDCSSNQLTSLDFSKNTALTYYLDCSYNKLTNLDISKNTLLQVLYCESNQLKSLDVSKNTALTSLVCYVNRLTSLDVSKNINLGNLICSDNQLNSLDVSKNTALTSLSCRNNQLTNLDVSKNIVLSDLDIVLNTNLTNINLKNGKKEDYGKGFHDTSLKYICCDESELSLVKNIATSDGISPEINTYCSFAPNGNKNTITGKISLDLDANGCDDLDKKIEFIKVKIENGLSTNYTMTLNQGIYNYYTQNTGDFKVTPIFENPYYTITPATVSFADANNNTKVQDFCIKPIANKNDLEVKIIPKDRARPGFNSKYELIYKNKGTTTLSGNVNFVFNKNYSVFQSSSVVPNSNSNGTILYSFSNLKPFEEKIITIELKHNTPTAPTFPLNGGEILNFSSIINPTTNDETLNDNTFALKQDVVNAYDPNDKTCLQGNSITPEMIGEFVDYQIRFENNGSAEATFIVVKDIIDTNLFDVETLSPTSSSHPYHLTIKNGNVVEFYFEDINLPFAPKEAKDPKAQGFISFKIKTKSTLKLGDVLKNKADIYFDYNKPILTNEELTKIENLNTEEITQNSKFKINFTNPATDKITFSEEVKSVSVFDLNGKLVQSSIVNGTEMDVSSLQNGTYILKISTENGIQSQKLIKK